MLRMTEQRLSVHRPLLLGSLLYRVVIKQSTARCSERAVSCEQRMRQIGLCSQRWIRGWVNGAAAALSPGRRI